MATRRKKKAKSTKKRVKAARKKTKEVCFEFYAPLSQSVAVAGTFNSWNPSDGMLERVDNGHWKKSQKLAPGRYEYRFWVDGNWEPDQKPAEKVRNAFGSENCILEVRS